MFGAKLKAYKANMTVLFIIPARGGSKGIPRKNVRTLAGKPLLQYSVQNALATSFEADVYVSSEDDEILNLAIKLGAKVHHRKADLSGDAITLDAVIYNAYQEIREKEQKQYDYIITLQPTSPLLKSSSIDEALGRMMDQPNIDTIISATNDTHLTWGRDDKGFHPNYTARLNRQYLDPVYKETGGFLITRDTVISESGRIGNKVDLFELDARQSIDIDTFEDWNLCEYHLKRKRIVFSVSGYSEIGLGHVYNTLVLANEILDHEVIFFCDNESRLGYDKIVQNNYPCHIQQTGNLVEEIISLNPDIVINDRLDTSASDILPYKEKGILVVNFEDLGEGSKLADLVFNAIYPEKIKLENHFFGPNYFCARDEFLLTESAELNEKVTNVLLTFGGVDPNNLTLKVLDSIYELCTDLGITINVVAGLGYKNYDGLARFEGVKVHKNVSNISDYMSNSDIAFTSAGRTTYELALLGVPSIVMAQNEREMTHFFASEEFGFDNLGMGADVSASSIQSSFLALVDSPDKRRRMRERMFSVDLRNGKRKVITRIKNLIGSK